MKSSTYQTHTISQYSIVRVVLGIFLMFACSQVSIPLQPVPITLQTVGTLIIGLTYRKKEALSAMGGFLLLGAVGVPVFSGIVGGFEIFLRGTGGYLIGMLFSVYVVASLRERFGEDSMAKLITYSIIGSAAVFLVGLPWLTALVGAENAIKFGLLPFIIPGIVKALFVGSSVRVMKNISWKKYKQN